MMSGVYYHGLDYTAAEAGLRLAGVEMTPDIWRDVRDIEEGARRAFNEGGS